MASCGAELPPTTRLIDFVVPNFRLRQLLVWFSLDESAQRVPAEDLLGPNLQMIIYVLRTGIRMGIW